MKNTFLFESVYDWIQNLYQKHVLKKLNRPFYIILNAPQGAGKTTLTQKCAAAFAHEGIGFLGVSIDDFYLTRQGQIECAQKNRDCLYLQERGYPGTHDCELGRKVLNEIKNTRSGTLQIPVYDKTLNAGLGDRVPEEKWRKVQAPVDILLLEGWMIGFPYQEDLTSDHVLSKINQFLPAYETWINDCDAFLYLSPIQLDYIVSWRVEAEQNQRSKGLPGMSDAHTRAYIKKFLPAYELYGPALKQRLKEFPESLHFSLNKDRTFT